MGGPPVASPILARLGSAQRLSQYWWPPAASCDLLDCWWRWRSEPPVVLIFISYLNQTVVADDEPVTNVWVIGSEPGFVALRGCKNMLVLAKLESGSSYTSFLLTAITSAAMIVHTLVKPTVKSTREQDYSPSAYLFSLLFQISALLSMLSMSGINTWNKP